MNRYLPLHRTNEFQVGRFDHPDSEPHSDPEYEASPAFSVSLVERGRFMFVQNRREYCVCPGDLLVTTPKASFRVRHHTQFPDDSCLSLTIHFPESPNATALACRSRAVPVRKATRRLRFLLPSIARQPELTLGMEAALLQFSSDLLNEDSVWDERDEAGHLARRLEAACTIFNREFDQPLALGEVARRVYLSPFHFSRQFAQSVGLPPHRYLMRIRLLHALRLLQGGESVTEACFRSGFSHLSHFGTIFHRTFRVLPSTVQRMPQSQSKKLIAESWLRT
jgi:AraC-like DNA-binding protein